MRRHRGAPEWWPEGEHWPPGGWSGGGPRHRRHARGWRPFGCMVLLLGLFAAGAMVMAIWAIAAIVGLVEAPPIVTLGGVVAFVLILVGGALAGRTIRRMTAPLDDLIEASGRIEAGDYTVRVPVSGGGGTRTLTRAFNQMSAQLESSDARRRAYLAEVTHELRTPLTLIQGQLEAIEDGVYEADPERIAALRAQAQQMAGLIEDLRTISLAEVGGLQLKPSPLDLTALAEEAVGAFAPAAELADVGLRTDSTPAPVPVSIDAAATGRVLGNLVTNALRHTPAGGEVVLRVRSTAAAGTIEVQDTGPGMDAALVERAFERFAKGPDSDGSGLGLAIARDLVEAQGGAITLESEAGAGTRVRVSFPLVVGP